MNGSLLVIGGTDVGLYLPLGTHAAIVGRDPSANMQVTDARLSRKHFTVRYDPDTERYLVNDLGSANGTRLNDRPIVIESTMTDEDELSAGESTFVIIDEVPADKQSALAIVRKIAERQRSTIMRKPNTMLPPIARRNNPPLD